MSTRLITFELPTKFYMGRLPQYFLRFQRILSVSRRQSLSTGTSVLEGDAYSSRLRNISICAHVDAGKSTLSDALLRITGAVSEAQIAATPQFLDGLSVERERGITVQLRAARMRWKNAGVITIVDTPGHCDFAAFVS